MNIAAVIVTYNRHGLLRECVQALKQQTYPLSLVVVIDNASTDEPVISFIPFTTAV